MEFYDSDGIEVELENGKARICANKPERVARGCFLLTMNMAEGKESFEITEEPVFETLGVMLDCSRNGVTTVEATKKYIDCMATLGFNMLLLYTEDTYEVPERSRFGYMRDRYTEEELREISTYGDKMGVELVPRIQTLGHLDQYLKWSRPGAPDYNDEHIYQMTDTGGGCETNFFLANTLLPICSEYCYRGIECPMEHIEKVSEYFTKIKYSDTEIIADFNYDTKHTPEKYVYGKRLFYADVLYDLAIDSDIAYEAVEKYTNGVARMAELMDAIDTLDRYLTGEISKIEELEADTMVSEAGYNAQAKFTITPTYAI